MVSFFFTIVFYFLYFTSFVRVSEFLGTKMSSKCLLSLFSWKSNLRCFARCFLRGLSNSVSFNLFGCRAV